MYSYRTGNKSTVAHIKTMIQQIDLHFVFFMERLYTYFIDKMSNSTRNQI